MSLATSQISNVRNQESSAGEATGSFYSKYKKLLIYPESEYGAAKAPTPSSQKKKNEFLL